MKPSEWMISILDRYGLHKPDGRPLYQYRITDSEFNELAQTLRLSAHMGIDNIRNMFLWDAAFVIYGAEWWRRHYTGEWGWDGIFGSVGIDYKDLSTGKRNDLIETGLHRWRRQVRVNGGRRGFLPTVATEGGLPLHQLADSGGWLKNILKPVLKKHVTREIDISVLVDSYETLIPKSYRTTELKNILADIVQTVIILRNEYQLMNKESPLQWLDENQPSWRELFPLPIDDEAGKSLLSDLIDTAAKAKEDDSNKNPFELERYLIRAESPSPEFISQLDMPTFVYLDSIGFDSELTDNSSTFDVEIYEPGGSAWSWCRAILTNFREKQALKFSGRSFKLSGIDAAKELKLRFKLMGRVIHEVQLTNGYALDTCSPWVFRNVDDKWLLQGVASQSVKSDYAIVYIPENTSYMPLQDDAFIEDKGYLFSGKTLKISGNIECANGDDKYKLSAGVEETLVQYHLTGTRFPYISVPHEVYVGCPDLHEINLITGFSSKIQSDRLLVKPIGVDTQWRPIKQVGMGCYEVRLLDDDGNIKLRKRIGILNREFSFNVKPDKCKVNSGSVLLTDIGNSNISVSTRHVASKIEKNGFNADIQLESSGLPPQYFDLSLLPVGQSREILLSLPFPSKGALLFDPQGKQVSFSTPLFLSELQGYRVKVFNENHSSAHKVDLRFSLIDPAMSQDSLRDIYIQRKVSLDAGITEFSLYDWLQFMDSLISVSSSLDSSVQVSMLVQGQEVFNISVRRYEKEILANWDEGTIALDSAVLSQMSLDVLGGTYLSTLFLNQPEQFDEPLHPCTSNGVPTGEWLFSPEKRQPGPWLIYPLKESQVKFRTLLWNVGESEEFDSEQVEKINTLPKAICVTDQHNRSLAIRKVLNLMAGDMGHKSWRYLDCLWKKTSHLPMVTFDLWKLAINETKFMACLLIQDYDEIVENLESELPLIWELVYLQDWEQALNSYKSKIMNSLGDDEELINDLVRKKIDKIESLNISMKSTGEILRSKFLDVESQGLKAMQLPVELLLKPALQKALQDLLRRNSENEWPMVLSKSINHQCRKFPDEYTELLPIPNPFQGSVVHLPLLLAWRLLSNDTTNWPSEATDHFKIQQLKQFDEDWFSAAFQYLSGWLSQQNKFEIK